MKSDREVLEEAIELIDSPDHWAQNAMAVTKTGYPTAPRSTSAQSWCALGALRRVCQDLPQEHRIADAIVAAGEGAIPGAGTASARLMGFNDRHLHSEVILAMKRGLDNL